MRSRRFVQERRKARQRRFWRRFRSALILLLVLALVGGAGYFAWTQIRGANQSVEADDYRGPGSGTAVITIEVGETGAEIGQHLVNADVVKSVEAFVRAFEANKAAASIRPGTYTLKKQMSASDAIAALLDEANRTENTVTVNPGQAVAQVVEKIADITDFSTDEINAALKDPQALGLPAEAGGNVEGWLAPGSYEISQSDTPTTLFAQMIAETVKELDSLRVASQDRQKLLVKASILEREVNIETYLPMVARVIENRLSNTEGETRGLLQMDSTVLYGVGKFGGIPTEAELRDDNPYNTYKYPGLPPAPIASPSRAAIEAVLKPADGDWLYYVTVNLDSGETLFAKTQDEQLENVEKFKKYCSSNPGKC
ncbi:endolytic transglycosylase MltG [Schaalia sp. ZJ405]|nr:endolytic transglycosylase MltG [Schaalia sp. ZJ405]